MKSSRTLVFVFTPHKTCQYVSHSYFAAFQILQEREEELLEGLSDDRAGHSAWGELS